MKHRLLRAAAALVIALGAVAVPSGAASVHAGSKVCTGWTSTVTPPPTIRVYRHAKKRVDVVPFRRYVEVVMASEWGASTAKAALEAGAVSVKQYAWYFAIHWRGKSYKGNCYDVVDSTMDQLYDPARKPASTIVSAVAATWWTSLHKGTRFFATGYRPGTGRCLAHLDAWHLYQRDATNCVSVYGDSAETILRRFYVTGVTTPGAHDVTGDGRGDLILGMKDPETGALTTQVVAFDPEARPTGRLSKLLTGSSTVETTLGAGTADVTGDGRADLVLLLATETGMRLRVLRATDTGLASAYTWWASTSDATPLPVAGTRLVLGDFDADGKADAGLVTVVTGEAPAATLYVARAARTGSRFEPVRRLTKSAGDHTESTFATGDLTGDGRADFVVLQAIVAEPTANDPAPAEQVSIAVARSQARPGSGTWPTMGAAAEWTRLPARLASLSPLVGDVNGDGRDDLLLARSHSIGIAVTVLASAGSRFAAPRWLGAALALPWATTSLVLTDLTRDGRADLVALSASTADAATVSVWRATMGTKTLSDGSRVPWLGSATRWLTDLPFPWGSVAAY